MCACGTPRFWGPIGDDGVSVDASTGLQPPVLLKRDAVGTTDDVDLVVAEVERWLADELAQQHEQRGSSPQRQHCALLPLPMSLYICHFLTLRHIPPQSRCTMLRLPCRYYAGRPLFLS